MGVDINEAFIQHIFDCRSVLHHIQDGAVVHPGHVVKVACPSSAFRLENRNENDGFIAGLKSQASRKIVQCLTYFLASQTGKLAVLQFVGAKFYLLNYALGHKSMILLVQRY